MRKIKGYLKRSKIATALFGFAVSIVRNFRKSRKGVDERNFQILFIGQVHSPHFASFFKRLSETANSRGIKFQSDFLCSYPVVARDLDLYGKVYDLSSYWWQIPNFKKWLEHLWLNAENTIPYVENLSKKWEISSKYDIVWVHDLQSGGYLLNRLCAFRGKCVATVYGNDLYYFFDNELHKQRLVRLCAKISHLQVESKRDVNIANQLGFKGLFLAEASCSLRVFKPLPNPKPIALRKYLLVVKGSYEYRSCMVLLPEMLRHLHDIELPSREVLILGGSREDRFYAQRAAGAGRLEVNVVEHLSHPEVMSILNNSIFQTALSLSEGVPNLSLEAIEAGCIPLVNKHCTLLEDCSEDAVDLLTFELGTKDLAERVIHLSGNESARALVSRALIQRVRSFYSRDKASEIVSKVF